MVSFKLGHYFPFSLYLDAQALEFVQVPFGGLLFIFICSYSSIKLLKSRLELLQEFDSYVFCQI